MSCHKCKQSGRCRNCSCVKNGITCQNCAPQQSGQCENTAQLPQNASLDPDSSNSTTINSQQMSITSMANERVATSQDDSSPQHLINTTKPFPDLQSPNFTWNSYSDELFCRKINTAYEKVLHWRRNLFQVPSGKSFISELARLYQAYADSSSLERIAMKATTIFPILLLQKPSRTSKSKNHVKHLQRRLQLWFDGNIDALLDEGECIQNRLTKSTTSQSTDVIARTFRNLMLQGKVQSALNCISRNSSGGILKLEDLIPMTTKEGKVIQQTTKEVLKEKHPIGKDSVASSLIDGEPRAVNPITFEGLDADSIRQAALHTHGAAGSSGLNAYAWRRLCSSFKSASNSSCTALADVGRRIATTNVNPEGLEAFVACRLIALDKCPGVRPIGVGEVPRSIANAILRVIGNDVVDPAGPFQLCAGQVGGCEAAVHAMRSVFQTPNNEAVLLVDANNAFNSLNRRAALHNINIICPSLAITLTNTYRSPVRMFVTGDGEIASTEGTSQGDPLAMAMYALAMKPLIEKLRETCPDVHQAWYADDATGASTCTGLRRWWNELTNYGLSYGYFPNDSKTYLVVKPDCEDVAKDVFAGTNVQITTHGKRHLGAALGSKTFTEEYVGKTVQEWTNDIKNLARIASYQPHAAYAAYTHGLSNR